MSRPNITPFLNALSGISGIKKTQVILPIAQKTGIVTPLMVGDDLELRSGMVNPTAHDRALIKLLHEHSEFIEETQNVRLPHPEFCRTISYIDKLSLVWGIYKATYDTLGGEREFECENTECKHKIKHTIEMDDLIHDDTYTLWDKVDTSGISIPFYEYVYEITEEYGDFVFQFLTRLPSIDDNNKMLSKISISDIQKNLQTLGTPFSMNEQMALVTKAARLTSKSNSFEPVVCENINELMFAFKKYIPKSISETFFDKYNEHFSKYLPKYYQKLVCSNCGKEFDVHIDIEGEFFRRSFNIS